jgi:hypothetical protein
VEDDLDRNNFALPQREGGDPLHGDDLVARLLGTLAVVLAVMAVLMIASAPFAAPDYYGPTTPR